MEETVEYPILIHCKSGADRAGLMSVLYRFLHEGVPLTESKRQLGLRYGHFRHADTGVLDHFFERYMADNAHEPIAFWDWVDTKYDKLRFLPRRGYIARNLRCLRRSRGKGLE